MVVMGKLSKIEKAILCLGVLGMLSFVSVASASETDKPSDLQASFVLKELQLRLDDAASAEILSNKRLASFERLIKNGSASPLELKRARANAEFATETRSNAEALLSYFNTLPVADKSSLEDTEMFLALPGLSLQVGLIGFGHFRVLNKGATLEETEKLIRFDRSNPSSLELISSLRDSQGRDQAKLADVYATQSEKRMVTANLAALNRRVKDVSDRTTGSTLLGESKLTLTDMLSDQNSDDGAGYLATLYSWSATSDPMELEATRDFCRVFAESSAEVDFAEAVVALAEMSADAKKTLLSRGSGSPLEVRIAVTKLGIAKAHLEQAKQNQAEWKAKEALVLKLIEAPLKAPESRPVPSTMAEAIFMFKELSESIELTKNDKLAQSGYSILMSQFDSMDALARSEKVRKLSKWRLDTLAKNKASELELKRAKLTLAKNEAYKQYRETICQGLAAKLAQMSAIGRTMKTASNQGKGRDNFSLPYSEMLASSLANYHELESSASGEADREMQIQKFYEWKHSQLLGLYKKDQESLEVHRVNQMLEESRLMMRQINEAQLLTKHRADIADKMFDALVGNQAPLSAGDLAADVRESLFGYHAVQLHQDSSKQLAQLNLQIEKEKLERVKEVKSKGMASVRELDTAQLREKIASIRVSNTDRRKDEIIGLSQQMAAAFGVADVSITSIITEE